MKILILFLGICIFPILLTAQNSKNNISSALNKNSISIIGLDFQENLSRDVLNELKTLKAPDKYYNNKLDNSILVPKIERKVVSTQTNPFTEKEIFQMLNENKVGQQIVSKWFNRQADSSFNFATLKERGLLNTNPEEFINASSTRKEKTMLLDKGLKLINQSYIIVFDFYNIKTLAENYKTNEIEEDKQTMNGYTTPLNCYLVKLDFNNSVASRFFNDFWILENDLERSSKIEAFEYTDFPFILLKTFHYDISATQHNPGHALAPEKQIGKDELLRRMVNISLEKVLVDIEKNNEPFKINTMIRNTKPIEAKIGRKGGLKFDERYFVYENRIRKNGKVYPKRIGVVKSNKVIDNRKDSLNQTQTSAFYQIAGGQINNYGMFLKKRRDFGFNFFLGNAISGLPGTTGRMEYYFSKIMDEMIPMGKTAKGSTSIKVYLSGASNKNNYRINEISELNSEYTFTRGSFGISKDYYPLHFLHWGPFIGYGLESVTWENSPHRLSTNFIEAGVRLGVNLAHNVQLIGSVNSYLLFHSVVMDENKDVLNEQFNYMGNFTDRSNFGTSIGIRIML